MKPVYRLVWGRTSRSVFFGSGTRARALKGGKPVHLRSPLACLLTGLRATCRSRSHLPEECLGLSNSTAAAFAYRTTEVRIVRDEPAIDVSTRPQLLGSDRALGR